MGKLRPVGDWIENRFEIFAVHPGGMGVVYVAHDHLGTAGRNLVAIKTLRDEWLVDADWSARFAAECELWVRLGSHPNIVHAVAVERFDGRPHILLELVTGGDLRRRIGNPALDIPCILDLGIQFCLGMDHAVRQGLRCHRDVKPGNLMLSPDGTLKITDFGLAVIRDELYADAKDNGFSIDLDDDPTSAVIDPIAASATPDPTSPRASTQTTALVADADFALDSGAIDLNPVPLGSTNAKEAAHLRLTQTGSLLGTLPYMAPEQFRDSKAVDIRADIYAFGIVLFQLLTTKLPFHGKTIARYDRAHERYVPPSVVPSIPRKYAREAPAIDAVVQRCLSKDPADRFESMNGLRKALTPILRRINPAAPRRSPGHS